MADLVRTRTAVQIASAALFIALLIAGLYYPLLGYIAVACMAASVIIAVFMGRKWCDFCPRGSLWDRAVSRLSRNKKVPKVLLGWHTRIFVMLFLFAVFTLQISRRWPDVQAIGGFFIRFLILTTIAGLVLGVLVQHRAWCRFCPIGTMGNLVGRGKYQMRIDPKCTGCRICQKVCPMQLYPGSHRSKTVDIVNEPDCIKCRLCEHFCPAGALKL